MDRSRVIYLISSTSGEPDKYGVRRKTETKKKVFCSVRSVTSQEFFEGGRNGLQPQYQVSILRHEYGGETIAELDGVRYGIYRTYVGANESLELYLETKGGTNG